MGFWEPGRTFADDDGSLNRAPRRKNVGGSQTDAIENTMPDGSLNRATRRKNVGGSQTDAIENTMSNNPLQNNRQHPRLQCSLVICIPP